MFLVKDGEKDRCTRIGRFLGEGEPAIAALLAVIHFEWTLRRALIALSCSPNRHVRQRLRRMHGLEDFKKLWKEEIAMNGGKGLPQVVGKDWQMLISAYDLRHSLAHGRSSCSKDYASVRVNAALSAASAIRSYAAARDISIYDRLPIRRKAKMAIQMLQV
jgi:hypothetical protein